MEEYTGYIRKIRFYNEDSNFVVADFEAKDELDLVTFSGIMLEPNLYDYYQIRGDFVDHPRYGFQFKLESYQILLSNSEQGVIAYLASPLFKGIGKKQAEEIVATLGENCLLDIVADPDLLDGVKGMTKAKKETILTGLGASDSDNEIMQFFYEHHLNLKHFLPIKSFYKERTLETIRTRPYALMYDIDGIGFKTCDELALNIGFALDDQARLEAALTDSLKQYCYRSGSVYCDYATLKGLVVNRIAGFDEFNFDEYLEELLSNKRIILIDGRYYDFDLYQGENIVAKYVKNLAGLPVEDIDDTQVVKAIDEYQEKNYINYAPAQLEAIDCFLHNSFSILTGGPGTGKTTVVRGLLSIYKQLFPLDKIALLAPTGRAAKRLSELTGIKAVTIHSLLKWDLHTNKFAHNQAKPLDVEVLIIDEFSMVDTLLFAAVARACPEVFKVLIIGDHHQLPSVMPGNLLNDLIQAGLPSVCLNEVFRQASGSGIIDLAHEIINDRPIERERFSQFKDINFFECPRNAVVKNIVTIVTKAISSSYGENDIQILAPMYQGIAGIDAINLAVRELFNPRDETKIELKVNARLFREGDKVLQLKNRPEDEVFNGDIGFIARINKKDNFNYLKDTIIVDFEGNMVEYDGATFVELTHAYCMSIHKSQGSEFKIVIMPVLYDYSIMLRRNLLYTGLSRAKQSLFILGEYDAFLKGLSRLHESNRKTSLGHFYKQALSIGDFKN